MTTPAPWIVFDRGPLVVLDGPLREFEDRTGRLDDLVCFLEVLGTIARPLALEAELATYDEDGVSKEVGSTWMTVAPLPKGVVLHTSLEHASPPSEVPRIGAAEVRRILSPPAPGQEWCHVRFLVSAARVVNAELQGTTLEDLPSRPIPVIELDGHRWAVGPVDFHAMQRYLPVAVDVDHWGLALQVRIEPRWSPWVNENTDEHKALMKAIVDLSARGFRPHE